MVWANWELWEASFKKNAYLQAIFKQNMKPHKIYICHSWKDVSEQHLFQHCKQSTPRFKIKVYWKNKKLPMYSKVNKWEILMFKKAQSRSLQHTSFMRLRWLQHWRSLSSNTKMCCPVAGPFDPALTPPGPCDPTETPPGPPAPSGRSRKGFEGGWVDVGGRPISLSSWRARYSFNTDLQNIPV